MSEQTNGSKNIFTYRPTAEGCCDILMGSTDTEETIKFPTEIDGLRVTGIGYQACKDCKNVKVVFVPEGATRIKSFAFSGCTRLVRINLPTTLEKVDADILYDNDAFLVTCSKGKRPSFQIDESRFPPKSVFITGVGAGKDWGNGTVGIYTVSPFDETYCEILYQKKHFLRVAPYTATQAEAALAAVKQSYELTLKTVRTYDVYSSDGVDGNDRDESVENIDLGLENLVFSEDGTCLGVFYKNKSLDGILFLDGTTLGNVDCANRELCYGHPLDYYINTYQKLTLKKRED
ncbi:MAG: hypothetical protein E7657_04525 [Ruminococcaceae bacterium]|nr:hypothetical protein [Oscillospiraceae bacterium]